jgi:hypothetical protein
MEWKKVNFGTKEKVKGKTLPQIIFIDPDWFYTQYEYPDSYLRKVFGVQAEMIYQKSRNIKPKNNHYIKYFLFCDGTSDGFTPISKEDAETKFKECIETDIYCQDIEFLDVQQFKILKRLDIRYPKDLKNYDKKSYKIFIDEVKEYLNLGKRISEEKAIEFFENDDNFVVEKNMI